MSDIFESTWKLEIVDEGRRDDLKKQFVDTDKVSEETFNYFVENDPTDKQKYLQWMLKQSVLKPDRYVHIKDVAHLFDKAVKSNKIKGQESDITQHSLEQADELAQGKEQEVTKTQQKKEEKGQATKIKETDDYLIVVPESYKASCFYGANAKWCISGKTSEYWESYWQKGVKIYIIIDKKQNKKYAVSVSYGGKKRGYDEQDKSITMEELIQRLGAEEKEFENIFQPVSAEDMESRVMDYIKEVCTQDENGFWDTKGDILLAGKRLSKLPVKFGVVKGSFFVQNNRLTTLEGAPQMVGRSFDCSSNRLTTLEGAPQMVGGSFVCLHNLLTSLEGSPKEIGSSFWCMYNKLTTLEGAPQKVGGKMIVGNNTKPTEELKKTVDRPYRIVNSGSDRK